MKCYFLTVDWCNRGKRGIFCSIKGMPFSKETPHTRDEMFSILGAFDLILNPQSIQFSQKEVERYNCYQPLMEYYGQYGIAMKRSDTES